MTKHKESFERMREGTQIISNTEQISETFESIAKQAEKYGVAELDTKLCWLKPEDPECSEMYTPELIFRIRLIGPVD